MTDRMTTAEYRALNKKKNKYNAKKTKLDDKTYDSKREANRAAELKILQKAGEIVQIFEQVPFELPAEIIYKADFVILWRDGKWTVEDSKGYQTDVYKLKKKLFFDRYGIEIVEV